MIPSEEWLAELYRKLPPPESSKHAPCGGSDEELLRKIAYSFRKPSLLDPRVVHVARCPHCMRRLMQLREETRGSEPQGRSVVLWASVLAAVPLCVVGLALYMYRQRASIQMSAVFQTLDLSTPPSIRGDPAQPQLTSLPQRTVELTLILPALSETGAYSVVVKKTRQGNWAVAVATGIAIQQGQQTRLKVRLHLERVEPGSYYLSTTHESNEAADYYPLRIVP